CLLAQVQVAVAADERLGIGSGGTLLKSAGEQHVPVERAELLGPGSCVPRCLAPHPPCGLRPARGRCWRGGPPLPTLTCHVWPSPTSWVAPKSNDTVSYHSIRDTC